MVDTVSRLEMMEWPDSPYGPVQASTVNFHFNDSPSVASYNLIKKEDGSFLIRSVVPGSRHGDKAALHPAYEIIEKMGLPKNTPALDLFALGPFDAAQADNFFRIAEPVALQDYMATIVKAEVANFGNLIGPVEPPRNTGGKSSAPETAPGG